MSEVFNLEKLYAAYLDCRKGKRKTVNSLAFEWNLERNLFSLLKDLKGEKYKPGRSICFVVKEPTPREIFAATFKDRIVHHLLVREIEYIGEKKFIFSVFSCRKGKGTHMAVRKLKEGIRKESENYRKKIYYAQLDIEGFFMSINHDILYSLLKDMIIKRKDRSFKWKNDILWLAKTVISHKPTENYTIKGNPSLLSLIPERKSLFRTRKNKGLPIGNYSSQFFANLYLNKIDHFTKRKLGIRHYFRYVDDIVILEKEEGKIENFVEIIEKYLRENLDVKISWKKTKIRPASRGIDFLGYFIKPEYVLIRKRVVKNLKLKIWNKKKGVENIFSLINSYFAHFLHGNSFNLRKNIYDKNLKKIGKNKKELLYYQLKI
ncbi:MAG: reverse transcriptase domain-containing protein [Candidatus Paceibacterota bacterium]|jgi:hypothetical protein|nr:reverse transcriptase domain-containing protein [Candidatus Paceibacterota bacterium]MDD3072505.1 reverse transcriptase domain-containing protein [Candidatus Paceibacterota bacterium]MDD4201571.1 reverse transcriptase domain-containing protein [Candidatus Paceibacterota bacterium]MDD4897338.1 reverse transcriptase domain-containing protein [Candidatus Paceibacterota bacterium]